MILLNKTERLFVILLIVISFNGYSQLPDSSTYQKCEIKVSEEKRSLGKQKINRQNKHSVSIAFFQDFSDTVIVFIDTVLLMKKYLFRDSTLVSTNYTGISVSTLLTKKKSTITIFYERKKKYLQFVARRTFPLYSVHYYSDKFCAVSARKNQIIIK